jgi:DNA-binding transcriptional regulator WhiA
MDYIFGKSEAALELARIVSGDAHLQANVARHLNEYFAYVRDISKINNRKTRIKALQCGLECELAVSDEIKRFIRNVKVAKRRQALI